MTTFILPIIMTTAFPPLNEYPLCLSLTLLIH